MRVRQQLTTRKHTTPAIYPPPSPPKSDALRFGGESLTLKNKQLQAPHLLLFYFFCAARKSRPKKSQQRGVLVVFKVVVPFFAFESACAVCGIKKQTAMFSSVPLLFLCATPPPTQRLHLFIFTSRSSTKLKIRGSSWGFSN